VHPRTQQAFAGRNLNLTRNAEGLVLPEERAS